MTTLNVYMETRGKFHPMANSADIMLSYDRIAESVPMMSFIKPRHTDTDISIRVDTTLVLSFLSRYKFHVVEVMGVDIDTDPLWRLLARHGVLRGGKTILIKLGL